MSCSLFVVVVVFGVVEVFVVVACVGGGMGGRVETGGGETVLVGIIGGGVLGRGFGAAAPPRNLCPVSIDDRICANTLCCCC